jgi:hypothetical protein
MSVKTLNLAYKILVGKPEGRLGKSRCKYEDHIKMDLKKPSVSIYELGLCGSA